MREDQSIIGKDNEEQLYPVRPFRPGEVKSWKVERNIKIRRSGDSKEFI